MTDREALASFNAFATVRFPALIWTLQSNRWCQRFLLKWLSLAAELPRTKKDFPSRPRSAQWAQWFLWPLSATFPVFLFTVLIWEQTQMRLIWPCDLALNQYFTCSSGFGEGRTCFQALQSNLNKGGQHNIDGNSKLPIKISIWLGDNTDTNVFLAGIFLYLYTSKQF